MWIKKRVVKILIVLFIGISLLLYLKNVYEIIDYTQRVSNKERYYNSEEDYFVYTNGKQVDDADISMEKNIKDILESDKDKIIIVDPGHGGNDPGKVGVNNQLEKDINLSIAFLLKDKLVESGFSVIMTRTEDVGLYNVYDKNKKVSDLRKRVEIVNTSQAICMVSIHQNSFVSNKERGAQVFYYDSSLMSKDLAYNVQYNLKKYHDDSNTRKEKSNESYYLLKKTFIPSIIVECGFLSNEEEANLLLDEKYQDSIAEAIKCGVISWSNAIIDKGEDNR